LTPPPLSSFPSCSDLRKRKREQKKGQNEHPPPLFTPATTLANITPSESIYQLTYSPPFPTLCSHGLSWCGNTLGPLFVSIFPPPSSFFFHFDFHTVPWFLLKVTHPRRWQTCTVPPHTSSIPLPPPLFPFDFHTVPHPQGVARRAPFPPFTLDTGGSLATPCVLPQASFHKREPEVSSCQLEGWMRKLYD